MKSVINNEGASINVPEATYSAMQKEFNEGVWVVYVRDIEGRTQIVVLPENFKY